MTGEQTPLVFACPGCKATTPVPLKDFASGTVVCPKCSSKAIIPDNVRYRRLIQDIDAAPAGEVWGAIAGRGLHAVRYKPATGEVVLHFVDTFQTKEVGVGQWAGKGQMLGWNTTPPPEAILSVAVLQWLEQQAQKGVN